MDQYGNSRLENIPEVESTLEKTCPTFSSSYFRSPRVQNSKLSGSGRNDPKLVSFYRPSTKKEEQEVRDINGNYFNELDISHFGEESGSFVFQNLDPSTQKDLTEPSYIYNVAPPMIGPELGEKVQLFEWDCFEKEFFTESDFEFFNSQIAGEFYPDSQSSTGYDTEDKTQSFVCPKDSSEEIYSGKNIDFDSLSPGDKALLLIAIAAQMNRRGEKCVLK